MKKFGVLKLFFLSIFVFVRFISFGNLFSEELVNFNGLNTLTEQINSDGPIDSLEILEPIIIQTFERGSLGPFNDSSLLNNSSTQTSSVLKTNSSPLLPAITSPTQPGDVEIDKTATLVPGLTNVWEVTLRIEGMDVVSTSDIVLVVDRSGSMSGTRLANAKLAAIGFVDTLLTAGSVTRIALVSFAGNVVINKNFTEFANKQVLIDSINALVAIGGTHTQAGMRQGQALLEASNADVKSLVLLSDGDPTYSFALNNPNNYLIPYPAETAQQTSALAPETAYNYPARVGVGFSQWWRYDDQGGTANDKYYNHGNSAIAEATFAKDSNTVVYTIALDAPVNGTAVLNAMASPGKSYTATPAQLDTIFQTIAGSINSAAQSASVSDPMGQGFTIPGIAQNLIPSQGTATFDSLDNSIFWNVGTLINPISPGSNIKYAELVYQIILTDDILDEKPNNNEYPTNGDAIVTYIDVDGIMQTIAFPIPMVNPVIVTIHKSFLDYDGQTIIDPDLLFNIRFNDTVAYDMQLNTVDTQLVFTIQNEGVYTFEEIEVTDNGVPGLLTDYDITYEVGGVLNNTFQFFQNSADQVVTVINQICTPPAPIASAQGFCSVDSPTVADLLPLLSDVGIKWYSDASLLNEITDSTTALITGNYYVTAISGNCESDSTEVQVTIETAKLAGEDGSLVICSSEILTEALLFTELGSTAETGGTWNPSITSSSAAGTYSYGFLATAQCPAISADVVVTVESALNPGTNGNLTICAGDTVTQGELFMSLGGNPNVGGTWTPVLAGAGTYTYTLAATSKCPVVSATVVVSEQALPISDAGNDISICNDYSTTLLGVPQTSVTYQWSTFSGNILGATSISLTVTPSDTTIYYFTVTDSMGCSSESSVTVNVYDCSIDAVNDVTITEEDSLAVIQVLLNDTIIGDLLDTSSLSITGVLQAVNGSISINANGTITYTPNANYNGLDEFEYAICDENIPLLCDTALVTITINPINDSPEANDDSVITNEDTPVIIDVALNDNDDIDPLGNIDPTTVNTTGLTAPLNGMVININPISGFITYTPNANFNGLDSFEYVICDDGNPLPALCDTAWVFISVGAVNDTPTISQPLAIILPEDSFYTFCPLVMDIDTGDILTITSCSDPVNGLATIDAMNCVTYTPNANYNGLDSMCLIVCDDGMPVLCDSIIVSITVNPVNDSPEANDDSETTNEDTSVMIDVALNDNDDIDPLGNIDPMSVNTIGLTAPLNGIITNINPVTGIISYTPNVNFNGLDSFEYVICDDGNPLPALCDTAWVFISVAAVNDTPTIAQSPIILPEDSFYVFCPTIFDTDGGVLTITSCGNPENGIILIDGNNCVTYTPYLNYNGTDTVCLIVCDNGNQILCDTIDVPILVTPVNDKPVALDDEEITIAYTPVTVDVVINDNDDFDPLGNIDSSSVNIVSGPENGTVIINPNTGEITYIPNLGFVGEDRIQYVVCDDGNPLPALCDTAWVIITVTPVDTDGDGVIDNQEVIDETDPIDPCDFLPESITFPVTTTVDCYVFLIPTGFSPNEDGVNDNFEILGIERYPNANLIIVNRWGNKVYESEDGYENDWDGRNEFGMTIGSRELAVGTYFLILDLGDGSDIIKGYIYLNR